MLQNRAARAVVDVNFEDADNDVLLSNLGWFSIQNMINLDMGKHLK